MSTSLEAQAEKANERICPGTEAHPSLYFMRMRSAFDELGTSSWKELFVIRHHTLAGTLSSSTWAEMHVIMSSEKSVSVNQQTRQGMVCKLSCAKNPLRCFIWSCLSQSLSLLCCFSGWGKGQDSAFPSQPHQTPGPVLLRTHFTHLEEPCCTLCKPLIDL